MEAISHLATVQRGISSVCRLERVRREGRTIEVSRVGNILCTCTGAAVAGKGRACPVTAKGGVNHDRMVMEVLSSVAGVVVREQSDGGTPGRWVGVAVGDIFGDLATREEPDGNAAAIPPVGENAAGLHVELVAEAVAASLGERATVVITVGARALGTNEIACSGGGIADSAVGTSVQGDLVVAVQVDAL